VAYDDDRDNPPNDRITLADLLHPFGRNRTVKKKQTARNTVDREYRCPGITTDGKQCKLTKRGEPGYVCHHHSRRRRR